MTEPRKVGEEEGGAEAARSGPAGGRSTPSGESGSAAEVVKADPQSSEAAATNEAPGTQPARGDSAPTTMRIGTGGASPVPPEERQADIPIAGVGETTGDQKIPARFDKSGGSLPVEATPGTRAHEEAVKAGTRPAIEEVNRTLYATHPRQKLTQARLEKMSKPEIRAVASDRDYAIGEGGRHTLIRKFLAEQEADEADDLHEEGEVPKEFREKDEAAKGLPA